MSSGGGGGGAQGGNSDNSTNILWAIGAIFAVGVVIWLEFSEHLKFFFLQVKMYELLAINFIVQALPLEVLHLAHIKDSVANALQVASTTDSSGLSLDVAEYLSLIAGDYLRYPVTVCLVLFAYFSYYKNILNKYKKHYNMHSLAKQECVEWPQIKPIIGLDLVSQPLNVGPWAMANTPLEFCKQNKLIEISVEYPKEFKPGAMPIFKMTLDQEKTTEIFIKQLGNLWHSPEHLASHKRALFAIFLARGCRDTKTAQQLLKQINESCDSRKPTVLNFDGMDRVWRKYYGERAIQEIVQTHAYEFTIFIDLLLLARQDGVLATADFLWLKPIDRLFWYVLSSVGRQTYFVEASGVHAHFLVEKALRRGLSVPYVQEAVKALDLALQDIIYVPEDEEKQELLEKAAASIN